MLKLKTYSCQICKTKPDQISHHKSHLDTEKHTDKAELFQLKLSKLSSDQLLKKYNTIDIDIIIDALVNTVYEYKDNKTKNKKLNSKIIEQGDNTNTIDTIELTSEEMSAQNITDTITNKDALKDKIHELNNYSRNNGAGIGMNSIKVFNILYGLKKIEEKDLFVKANLKVPDAKFSYLVELANKNTSQSENKLVEQIITHALNAISRSNIDDLLMYEIPKEIKGSVFAHLIKEIDNITKIEKQCNVLLSGKIYEYFIGRDETAITELGAYFTDTHITNFIYNNKLKPTINADGTIGTMIDMFGGAGGFTTGYINYLNTIYNNTINWDTELKKIFHFDINQDVIKSAGLELFCLTGTLPDMKNNVCYANSFVDSSNKFKDTKYKYVVTNPPYGGDKNKESDAQVKRNKIKVCIKKMLASITDEDKKAKLSIQLKELEKTEKAEKQESEKSKVSIDMASPRIKAFAKKYSLKGNDKESVSLMLIMDIVDLGGTAIGVLKEGVFFNKTYKALRKCLVENFNVREIISVPQDQFENTSTKTSIVIFDNLENITTTEVKFYDLVVEKYTEDKFIEGNNGFIYLLENKDDIKGISDKLISSATRDEILNNPIVSLNGKDYNKKEINCGEGYELVKLGDISIINKNKKLDKTEYNYVEISDINDGSIIKSELIQTVDLPANAKNIGEYGNILISCVRPKKSKMMLITKDIKNIEKYVFSSALANIKLNDVKISYYVYGMLYILVENFEKDLCNGSSYPRFKPSELNNLKIPIPKSTEKLAEWVEKISKPYNEKNTKQAKLQELEQKIQFMIKNITENEDCDEVELGSVLLRCTNGKTNSTSITNTGEYKFYSATAQNPNGTHNKYDFDGDKYFIFAKSGGNSKTIFGDSLGIGKFWLISGKIAANIAMIKFNININFNINYVNYYLKYLLYDIQKFALYTTGNGNINVDDMLKKFKIKIPKNKKRVEDMEPLFKEIDTLQNDVKKAEELYKQMINELSQEAIPNQPIINEDDDHNSNDETESTETEIQEEEIVVMPITTKKKIAIKLSKSKKTSTT